MRVLLKRIIAFSLFIFIIGGITITAKALPIMKDGYQIYDETLKATSIEVAIKEIKNDENYVPLSEISNEYLEEVIKTEDKRFYNHIGIDFIAITRAMYNNLKAGYFAQGGSTITQQLAKNMFFSSEKNYERKFAELLMAFKLEKMLSKKEILELYCNVTYLGDGCYGVKEAAEYYYNTNPKGLTSEQISTLVFSFRNPSKYNPKALEEAISY